MISDIRLAITFIKTDTYHHIGIDVIFHYYRNKLSITFESFIIIIVTIYKVNFST
jgi:hypothetical protein